MIGRQFPSLPTHARVSVGTMAEMKKAVPIFKTVLAAGVSCDPRRFDDLADDAWVQFAERDASQASGDWGIEVVALPMPSGKQGARFVSFVTSWFNSSGSAG